MCSDNDGVGILTVTAEEESVDAGAAHGGGAGDEDSAAPCAPRSRQVQRFMSHGMPHAIAEALHVQLDAADAEALADWLQDAVGVKAP